MLMFMKKISVIIINYNTPELTLKAIKTLQKAESDFSFDFIVIDNNSKKPLTYAELTEIKNAQLIVNDKNLGFACAVNQGISLASGEYILLLNSDVFVFTKAISKLIKIITDNKKVGVVGPKMQYPNGKVQVSFGKFPTLFSEFMRFAKLGKVLPGGTLSYDNFFNKKYYKKMNPVNWVSGGCMLIRKQTINEVGLFDGNYFFGIEDIDYGYRAQRKGWQVIFEPASRVLHYHGQSVGGRRSLTRLRYEQKGIEYFLKKFKTQNYISIVLINYFYYIKIFILKFLGLEV